MYFHKPVMPKNIPDHRSKFCLLENYHLHFIIGTRSLVLGNPSTIAYGIIRKACEPILEEIALRQETSKSILEIPNEVVCVCRYVYVLWALCGQSS